MRAQIDEVNPIPQGILLCSYLHAITSLTLIRFNLNAFVVLQILRVKFEGGGIVVTFDFVLFVEFKI